MGVVTTNALASVEFSLRWRSSAAAHVDCYLARKVNFWRDILPAGIYHELMGLQAGDVRFFHCPPEELVPGRDPENEFDVEQWQFDRRFDSSGPTEPRAGRFYPKGILKAIPGIFRSNREPFRCVEFGENVIGIDFNHPLSGYELDLEARILEVREKHGELGGSCTAWIETLTTGPGMQARWKGRPTDFFSDRPFHRNDERVDSLFYEEPRLVTHVDDAALSVIGGIYGSLLGDGMRVLDLMSSWRSHVPESLDLDSLVGVGLNAREMEENPRLTGRIVSDLNGNPVLPFEDARFDAVICSVSVEYLTSPRAIFEESARVLRPGGVFIVTFSNRWFEQKVTRIWTELHEFERIGLVLEHFVQTGEFSRLHTYSMRGLPRPEHDRYYPAVRNSDPVYAVWGFRAP